MKTAHALILATCLLVSTALAAGSPSPSPAASQIQTLEGQLAQHPDDPELLLALGKLYHMKGAQGDKEAVERSKELLEKLVELRPEDAVARCWYGSALTLSARDALLPVQKVWFVDKGTKEMDRAVELAPDSVEVRMLRAQNSLSLPEMFDRRKVAIADLEHLKAMSASKPGSLPEPLIRQVLMQLGGAYKDGGEVEKAKASFNQVIALFPASEEAGSAKKLLQAL